MNKKLSSLLLSSICLSIFMTGCGDATNGAEGQQAENLFRGYQMPERHFVINRNGAGNMDQYNRFGFERHTKKTAYAGQNAPDYATYDRSLLADSISKMATTIQSVEDCAVLVTDQYVLMTYETNGTDDRQLVADQVKKTAMSLVPSYYDIYVSDDPEMGAEIERFEGLSAKEPQYLDSLEETIEQMKRYPQGEESLRMEDDNGDDEHNVRRFNEGRRQHRQDRTIPNQ
ncbi:YhcN/YlaJ family sporulation lipoprotein [Bacillus shivajii]|uniref:YhcN/YlaJ family sporulation lipoprotein n=1 Tax=Bacillus shivajii TaxID=1983719 RepID=UPI001CFA085D|nr:YhcN/YlaJ family sporulation lipoprotein [Bacillus shivajii]UCZ52551.1 YhcN/YlaJ family sporulation lipoprotein [Bacillus shivajii]